MSALHRAALLRAYRTLAQGLGGSAVSTALAALIASLAGAGDQSPQVALIAAAASLGSTLVAAFGSFWQGVAGGLPEAEGVLTSVERVHVAALAAAVEPGDPARKALERVLDGHPGTGV